jgi:DNA recombination-dependent growth factor C
MDPSMFFQNLVLFRLHREMHMALSLLPRRTQQLRETGETGEN